jgi:hypothetical protein
MRIIAMHTRILLALLLTLAINISACSSPNQTDAEAPPTASGPLDGPWQVQFDGNPLLVVDYDYARVAEAGFRFWAQDWRYASSQIESKKEKDGTRRIAGFVDKLGLKFRGTIASQGKGRFNIEYEFDAAHAMKNVIGGGLGFKINTKLSVLAGRGEPELLPNNSGWRWKFDDDQELRFEFDPPIASVYKERGKSSNIRAFFFADEIKAGKHQGTIKITLPSNVQQMTSLAERYGPADLDRWLPGALSTEASPVDLSFMNQKPAGKHGFINANGQHLQFADGTPAKFWGTNVQADALFADRSAIKRHAHRIAQLGFNLVRLHHHDSMGWVKPCVIHTNQPESQHLNADALVAYDWWVKCLKDEGVYVWMDLHTGRQFKRGDAVPGFDELARQGGEAKGFCYYNDRVEELMKEFNEKFLTRKNQFTGVAYVDEPAIISILITNENDITGHFGNRMLPDKKNPHHNAIFDQRVRAFCRATGQPYDKAWRTWESGPSKLALNDEEHKFHQRMKKHLKSIGVRVPVATTNTWGGMPTSSLPSLTTGDLIDVHTYGKAEFLSRNPRYTPNFVSWIAAGQTAGMPLSVTEWNVEYPSTDRFAAPTYLASIASLQGWDAMMLYGYAQRTLNSHGSKVHEWAAFGDPALMGMMPAAAAIFRQGHVSPAKNEYQLDPEDAQLCTAGFSPDNSAAIRTLAEQSRLTIAMPESKDLPWLKPTPTTSGVTRVKDMNRDFIPAGKEFVESDTGQLRRNWAEGVQTIDTPKSQTAAGWLKGHKVALTDVEVNITTPKAVVSLSSLDDQPLKVSKKILLTAIARAQPGPSGRMPFFSERVAGTVTINSSHSKLQLIPLASSGVEMDPIELKSTSGRYTIELPVERGSHWYYLTAE